MWKFLSKSEENPKEKQSKSINGLTADQKYTIDQMQEENCKPSEISSETGVDQQVIYRYIELKKKKETQPINNDQPMQQTTNDLKEKQEEIKLEILSHELTVLKETNKLDLEIKKADLEATRTAELEDDPIEIPEIPGVDMGWIPLMNFLSKLLDRLNNMKGSGAVAPNAAGSSKFETINKTGSAAAAAADPPDQKDKQDLQDLNDEEIQELLDQIPKSYKILAKGMRDDQLKEYINARYAYSDKTLTRAIEMLRKPKEKEVKTSA